MGKTALKKRIWKDQDGMDPLTIQPLQPNLSLVDTDRIDPKANGGTYTEENTRIVSPRAHMRRHGTLRVRAPEMANLKEAIDAREQIMKLKNKVSNQILAYERKTDTLDEGTLAFLKADLERVHTRLKIQSQRVSSVITTIAETDALAEVALEVDGIGPITVAYCLAYIDLEKARHASSLWSYTGLDKSSHKRYTKGQTSGGNKKLRTALYTMAESQMKTRGPYREVYDREKEKKAQSTAMVKSRTTQGKLEEMMWKETKPSHRHGHALRMVMKHFLADYWMVGRTLMELDTNPLYAEAVLKTGHRTIMPEERGWSY